MSFIPTNALRFGALNPYKEPVSYGKARIARSKSMSYIMHSKAGCMPGQPERFTVTGTSNPYTNPCINENTITNAFKREKRIDSKSPSGIPNANSPYNFTFELQSPHDDNALHLAIKASYRQIFGNFHPMDSERPIDLERRLRNGDINIREFIRGLTKSDFYLDHYFNKVTQQRFVELNFKHLLGRAPSNQSEVIHHIVNINNYGIFFHIDSLIDSVEYEVNFGSYIVPYIRSWTSEVGLQTSNFNHMAQITQSYATSDNAIHQRKTLADSPGGNSQLIDGMAKGKQNQIPFPSYPTKTTSKKDSPKNAQNQNLEIKQ
ncbi:phycobilisome rod-core linker polypeptide [Prochlorococcus sp. MIT 1300]|uniref:phycobilisome rod-core linker polypeptide n=1 Tax=Prochlorococcus sp. MIT 1300 TaxID=3096218 RepID=UPI002A75A4BB|nr:phycobilisome rod-core linker polypeptide [Prochlorococcus sp. MIT 1300]